MLSKKMYSKIRQSESFSRSNSEKTNTSSSDTESGTNTITEYDSPSPPVTESTPSSLTDNNNGRPSSSSHHRIPKNSPYPKVTTSLAPTKKIDSPEKCVHHKKPQKPKRKRYKNGVNNNDNNSLAYTYETIIGIHLCGTSNLKFKKYIKTPRVKVSIYDAKNRSLLRKSDQNRNVVQNMEPNNLDFVMPIISKEGALNVNGNFAFTFDETLIFNEDSEHIKDDKVLIIFEIIDTIVPNFKNRLKLRNSDGWHYISWAFLRPYTSEKSHMNKRRTLQLYKYRKSKRNAPILDHWSDVIRKKYPGTLDIAVREIEYHPQDHGEIELSRPRTALQKDKQFDLSLNKDSTNSLSADNNENFIIASTSSDSSQVQKIAASSFAARLKSEKILPLIKLRNFFRKSKFECPTEELVSKQLAGKCSVCRFSEDGTRLAYGETMPTIRGRGRKMRADIVIADSANLNRQYVLKGHTAAVHCLRWMPAAIGNENKVEILLSSSEDHTCILWYLDATDDAGNYSMEVLPHSGAVYAAEFLQFSSKNEWLTIASGGRNAILYIWRIDMSSLTITGADAVRSVSKTILLARAAATRRSAVCLEQEISKHEFHIVDIVFGRESHRIFTGDVGGNVMEWIREKDGNRTGSVLWTCSRTFTISPTLTTTATSAPSTIAPPFSGLHRLEIVDKMHAIYAVTTGATLHRIDTKTGHQREIANSRILSEALIKSMTVNFTITNCGSFLLFTSDTNKITFWNLRTNATIETISIGDSPVESLSSSIRDGFIRAIDFTIPNIGSSFNPRNDNPGRTNSSEIDGRSVLAISLSSKSSGNFLFLYGSRILRDNTETDAGGKSMECAGNSSRSVDMQPSIVTSNSDGKNISRLSSFFTEVLDKCDRIIRYGATNGGYKLANDSNSMMDGDIDGDDDRDDGKAAGGSDRDSLKSNGTFTIDGNSEGFGNTFSLQKADHNDNDDNDEDIDKDDNTFTIENSGKGKKSGDETDISEALESIG